ncbi:MAG: hypothetical protein RMK29_19445 [Myxococcales bacterium]|nr:hypothetical protein [Myxococcota bacterium]MDW8283882.1 hypothetical protein [Myxococcales bacterium]
MSALHESPPDFLMIHCLPGPGPFGVCKPWCYGHHPSCPGARLLGAALALLATASPLLVACGPPHPDETGPGLSFGPASTAELGHPWQPFTTTSVWNLKLSPTRSETPIPAAAMALAPMALSDTDYGVRVYFAKPTDPEWRIGCGGYNSWLDTWPNPCPVTLRAPATIHPPSGSDGIVVVVEPSGRYAYEMYQFRVQGSGQAYASYIEVVDVHSNGIHRNVGVTGAGLPGIGGLLKAWETKDPVPIRHKLWVAAHSDMLYAQAVWPASRFDVTHNGRHAFLRYGDVVALSKTVDVNNTGCGLSPFMKRIAQALQDYGGIVQDRGGDSLGFVGEVDAVRNYIDIDYHTTMWTQLACLKKFMVRVNDPWTGATPGGLGFDAPRDTTPPSTPAGLVASATGTTTVRLDWADSTDDVGVTGYHVFRDGALVAAPRASEYHDSGLRAGTRYSYFVRAHDAAGNVSAASATATVTTPSTSPAELLSNGSFEGGTAPWSLQVWTGSAQVRLCTDRARTGQRSFCITNPPRSDGAAVHPFVPVTAGARYQASAWLWLQGISSGAAVLMIDWFRPDGSFLSLVTSAGRTQNTTTWVQETLTATAPPGAAYAMVFLFSYATGTVYYDDASFRLAP